MRFGKNLERGTVSKGKGKKTCKVSFTEVEVSLQRRQRGHVESGLENLVGGDNKPRPGVLDTQEGQAAADGFMM